MTRSAKKPFYPAASWRQPRLPLLVLPFYLATSLVVQAAAKPPVLEELLVTAQKREQRLLDVPIALSVVDEKAMARRPSMSLTDIAAQVPGLQVSSPNGKVLPIFAIRGVSMSDYNVNQASPVGVYLDDMNLSSNYTHGLALFDLERIEVLRGPQGTLYGKNTTGGAVNLVSRVPDFDSDGYLQLSAGRYDHKAVRAAYEMPLVDQVLAGRMALQYEQTDGFSDNHFPGGEDLSSTDQYAARLTLNYQPHDSLRAILRFHVGYSDPETQAVVFEPTDPGGLDRLSTVLQAFGQPFYQRPDNYDYRDTDSNKVDHTRTKTEGVVLTINKILSSMQLTSVTGYYSGDYDHLADSDGTPQELLESDWRGEVSQWSQDLRLMNLSGDQLTYTVGLYAAKEQHEMHNHWHMFHGLEPLLPGFSLDPASATGFSLDQQYEQERESYAIYGQFEYRLTNDWTLTGGLRFSEDKNHQFNVHTYVADYNDVPVMGLIPFAVTYDPAAVFPSQTFVDREWTGTAKADYALNDHTMLYASYSRGYRSGAFNGAAVWAAAELAPVDPEFVDAFELGAKGRWLDGRLEYSAALFHYDYQDQQFLKIVGFQQLLDSADEARSRGLELEVDSLLTDALQLHFGLALLDAEYTDGPVLNAGGSDHVLTGNDLIGAPEISADAALDYQFDWRDGEFNLHLDISYVGERWFTAFNNDAGHKNIGQSGYSLVNGRVDYSWANDRYRLSLWAHNLTDKEYQVYAINLSDAFGYHYTIKGAPRTLGADFRIGF